MKFILVPVIFSLLSANLALATESTDKDILASRGQGSVTQEEFTARADRIPANIRRSTLRDTKRLQDVINAMLLQSQLATAARTAGFDKAKIVQDRMRLAADAELANAWLDHYVDMQPEGDYEAMAREYYELNKDTLFSAPAIDVSHILISTTERSPEEAAEIANEIEQQLADDPGQFDALVLEYSDDPSAASNKGHFKSVKKGDLVKPFEEVAFAMQEGEISAPVETGYGLHIIRLDALLPATQMTYEDVKDRLIESERARHRERIKTSYLTELTNQNVNMTEEALEVMVKRQFGENYQDEAEEKQNR